MSAETIAAVLIKLVFMGAIGFGLRKTGVADDTFDGKLSTVLLNVAMPCAMLNSGNAAYSDEYLSPLLWAAVILVGLYAAGYTLCTLLCHRLPLPRNNQSILINMMVLGNVSYAGLPVIAQLYGAEGNLFTSVYALTFNLVAFSVGIVLMGDKFSPKSFLKNPITIAATLSFVIFFSPLRFPAMVLGALETVGGLAGPLSMFVLGSSLATVRFKSLFTSGWAWLVNLIRMVVFPLAVAGVLWGTGQRGLMPSVLVILTAMPPAVINVVFARQYKGNLPLAARTVSQGLVLMVPALPLYALLCLHLF